MLCELNEVTDHLYIASVRSVTDTALREKGITCVINCSLYKPNYQIDPSRYYDIKVEDNEREDIAFYFDTVANIINEERQAGGKALVYCVAGISRSATFCIAYLMKYTNMTLREAFRYLRSRRKIVRPNNGFFEQLIEYERRLHGRTTVEMVHVQSADSSDCVVVPDVFHEVCKGIVWLRSCKNLLRK